MPWTLQYTFTNPPFKPRELRVTRETVTFDGASIPLHEVTAVSVARICSGPSCAYRVMLGDRLNPKRVICRWGASESRSDAENEQAELAYTELCQLLDEVVADRIIAEVVSTPLPMEWGGYRFSSGQIEFTNWFERIEMPWSRVMDAVPAPGGWKLRCRDADGDETTFGFLSGQLPNARWFPQIVAGLVARRAAPGGLQEKKASSPRRSGSPWTTT